MGDAAGKKVVTTANGKEVEIDTTNKACVPFGFNGGDKIVLPNGDKATVLGVGPSCDCILCQKMGRVGKPAVYMAIDNYGGAILCTNDNLVEIGCKLVR